MAAAEALIDMPPLRGHYITYYQWHAENQPGYRLLYDRFTAEAGKRARAIAGADFASASLGTRQQIVNDLRPCAGLEGLRWSQRLRLASALDPGWLVQLERYLFQETLWVFGKTDAWLRLGYESWPASARGFDDYLHAPRKPT
jgi:hypothetical protein